MVCWKMTQDVLNWEFRMFTRTLLLEYLLNANTNWSEMFHFTDESDNI